MKSQKLILVVLIILFAPVTLYAQNNSLNQGYVEQKEYYITFPYTEIKGKIVIEVLLNNKPRKFVLDTGAPTTISDKIAQELNLKTLEKIEILDQSGAKDSINKVSLSEIKIGGISFRDTPTIVTKDLILFECIGVDGLIGSNLLRNSIVQFNSKNKTIILTNKLKSLGLKTKYSSNMELSFVQSNPFILVKLKKDKITANEKLLFDTGADSFYELSVQTFNQLAQKAMVYNILSESKGTFSFGLHGAAELQYQYLLTIPKLEINKVTFENVLTRTTYANSSRIGSNSLKYGIITLDYSNKKFYLQPFDEIVSVDLKEKCWAIEPSFKDNKVIVGIIWDKSLDTKVNVGDEILKFDTIEYEKMNFCDVYKSSNETNEDKATLVLKDVKTGEIKNIEVTKMESVSIK